MSATLSKSKTEIVQVVTARELFTVARARSPRFLLVGVLTAVIGIAVLGGEPRYLPTITDLLLPLELIVPTVAIALSYRPIASDSQRGELAVLDTYPISSHEYVTGVFLGRAIALVAILMIPLLIVGVYIATTSSDLPTLFAVQQGADSPVAFARFMVLTNLFGLTILSVSLALSALARSRQTALVLAAGALIFIVIVFDLLILRGFTNETFASDSLLTALAFSPTSAYRGLVFETVLNTTGPGVAQAASYLNVGGLLVWLFGSLVTTVIVLEQS